LNPGALPTTVAAARDTTKPASDVKTTVKTSL